MSILENPMVLGYLLPLIVTLVTFRKLKGNDLRIIVLIALCPIINVIGLLYSLLVGMEKLHKKGYFPISDD